MLSKDLKCVIICGGKGTRLYPITDTISKSLVPIKGKPLLHYIVDYCRQFTNDFMFIFERINVGLEEFIKTLPVNSECVIEDNPRGIANALFFAEDFIKDQFIVSLGDCIYNGKFDFPEKFDHGFGVVETTNLDYIKRSYSVEVINGKAQRVVEKPQTPFNNLCGMGFYVFRNNIYEFIKKTSSSPLTGKVELTDVIQTMISSGQDVKPIFFNGKYLNITYPEDLKVAEQIVD